MIKACATLITKKMGIDTHKILFDIFERNAKKVLENKYSHIDVTTKNLLQSENERSHYGDIDIKERASEYVLTSFTLDRIEFIKKHAIFDNNDILADLGDSNGIFLRSCQRDGISVNISDPAVIALHARGIETVKAHIEYLPFKDNSIHTFFLFETLEHVSNPITLLNEIGRVCSDSLIMSIPFVEKTKIHSYNYDPSRPIYQHHIFEFNRDDFLTIITHTHFSLESDIVAVVLDEKMTFFDWLIFFLWDHCVEHDTFCGCFKKFYICKLSKKSDKIH
jgi:hypothetical protein